MPQVAAYVRRAALCSYAQHVFWDDFATQEKQ
jgi:hypothetical protein